jgi:hypothetical protein
LSWWLLYLLCLWVSSYSFFFLFADRMVMILRILSRALLIWLLLWVFSFSLFGIFVTLRQFHLVYHWILEFLYAGPKSSPADGRFFSFYVFVGLGIITSIGRFWLNLVTFVCFSKPGSRQCRTPSSQRISLYQSVVLLECCLK